MATPKTPIRWGRVATVVCITLLLFEAASQLFVYQWAGEPYQSFQVMTWSPYGLVRNNPRYTSPQFKHNADGFRDTRTLSKAKPPKTLRVMLLGASVLYGAVTPTVNTEIGEVRTTSDQTISQYFEALIEADAAFAGVNVEVINAGVSFNRHPEMVSAYLTEYIFWQPDVVVVMASYNNLGMPVEPGLWTEGKAKYLKPHPWRLEFERVVNELSFASAVEKSLRTLGEASAAMGLTLRGGGKVLDKSFGVFRRLGKRLMPPTEPFDARRPEWRELLQVINGFLGYKAAMLSAAAHHGQYVAFFWEYRWVDIANFRKKPKGFDAHREYGVQAWSGDADTDYLRAHFFYIHRVRDWMAAHGGLFIDPLEDFIASTERIFVDYLHYTPAGNRVAAEVMFDRLRPVLVDRARTIRGG
jgi:hypothetical protein